MTTHNDDFRYGSSTDTSLRARLRRFFYYRILYPGNMIACPACGQDCFKSRRTRSNNSYTASPLCLLCWDQVEHQKITEHHLCDMNRMFQQYPKDSA